MFCDTDFSQARSVLRHYAFEVRYSQGSLKTIGNKLHLKNKIRVSIIRKILLPSEQMAFTVSAVWNSLLLMANDAACFLLPYSKQNFSFMFYCSSFQYGMEGADNSSLLAHKLQVPEEFHPDLRKTRYLLEILAFELAAGTGWTLGFSF